MKQFIKSTFVAFLTLYAFLFVFTSCDSDEFPNDENGENEQEQRETKCPTDFLPYQGESNWVGNLANDQASWTENWIDNSSGTDSKQYAINEEGHLRFWTEANSKQRPKVMHKNGKTFTTGEYKWRVYIPEMGMNERVSIGAFLYNDGDHELDFEIGSGTARARSKHAFNAFDDEVLMFLTSQNFPSHQFVHPIKVNAWYDLAIKLTKNNKGNYFAQWFVNGYEVTSVDLQYGTEVPFGIHCSLENLDFMGDKPSTREHYVLFDKVSYLPVDPNGDSEEPTGPKVSITTSKEIGADIKIRVDSETNVWIDLNNNKKQDAGEAVSLFGEFVSYTIQSQELAIYGDITRLQLQDNQLTALDVSQQENLNWLTCQRNDLSSLDLSNNLKMTYLNVDDNNLSELDLNQNNFLYLSCSNNAITSLNVNNHTKLDYLSAAGNLLTSLDLSNNKDLHWLDASNNELSTLKVSNVRTGDDDWVTLRMHGNKINGQSMTSFINSLANTTSGELVIVNTKDENEENVATVANVNAAKAKGWTVFDWMDNDDDKIPYDPDEGGAEEPSGPKVKMTTSKEIGSEIVIRVDSESDVWIDLNNNKKQDAGEAVTVFGDFASYTIQSQALAIYGDITRLQVQDNQLTTLDVSQLENLNWLTCQRNNLFSLDLSNNLNMTYLNVDDNNLASLNLTQNNFVYLSCNNNAINSLSVNNHTKLDYLSAAGNKLTSLDLSNCEDLNWLDASNNELSTLKVSSVRTGDDDWGTLRMHGNKIKGQSMTSFINSLANTTSGELVIINTKDENEGNEATVENVNAAKAKGWAVYDYNDDDKIPYEPGEGAEDPAGPKVSMTTSKGIGDEIKIRVDSEADVWIDLNNNKIQDEDEAVTVFGDFATYTIKSKNLAIYGDITRLQVQDNQLTALDVSQLENLNWLTCQRNDLSSLDLSNNLGMTYLNVDDNNLAELNLTQNNFVYLSCSNNAITSLNLTNHTKLDYLSASGNLLTSLDLSNCEDLHWLDASNNELSTLKVSNVRTGDDDWVTLRMHGNKIKGQSMTSFINSLAETTSGELVIINTKNDNEENVATVENVNAAKAKGWKVYDHNGGDKTVYAGN
ncbi:MAG: leucine-rich repeat domain-containing protein [Fermentimonas sp.]|jgi:hypothetical protein